jgi:hypothetical protein
MGKLTKLWDVNTKEKAKRAVTLVSGKACERETKAARVEPVMRNLIITSTHKVAGSIAIYQCVFKGRGKHEYSIVMGDQTFEGMTSVEACRNFLAVKLFQLEQQQLT